MCVLVSNVTRQKFFVVVDQWWWSYRGAAGAFQPFPYLGIISVSADTWDAYIARDDISQLFYIFSSSSKWWLAYANCVMNREFKKKKKKKKVTVNQTNWDQIRFQTEKKMNGIPKSKRTSHVSIFFFFRFLLSVLFIAPFTFTIKGCLTNRQALPLLLS